MMNYLKLFSLAGCAVYSCAMVSYMGSLFGFKRQVSFRMRYFISCITASGYTLLTLHAVPIPVIYILSLVIVFLVFRVTVEGTFLQHIFATENCIFHSIAVRGITLALLSIPTSQTLYQLVHTELFYMLSLSLTFLLCFLYLVWIFPKLYPLEKIQIIAERREQLKLITNIQAIMLSLLIVGSSVYYLPSITLWISLYHFIVFSVLLVSFYILFDFCIKNGFLRKTEELYPLYKLQLEKQADAYITQIQYVQSMRKLRHDWLNLKCSLFPIPCKDGEGRLWDFKNHLDDALKDLSGSYTEFSVNPLIQAILLHTQSLCRQQDIQFDAAIILPDCLPLSDFDLCRIFTNITNNALEANELLSGGCHKYIHIVTSARQNWCTITCINSFNSVVNRINQEYVTTKEDTLSHGFGIKNINEILESCGGFLKLKADTENGIFQVRIHIPLG